MGYQQGIFTGFHGFFYLVFYSKSEIRTKAVSKARRQEVKSRVSNKKEKKMNTSVGVVVLASHTLKRIADSLFSEKNRPTIHSCVDNILKSGIDDIAVVVNREQWEIGAALSGYPVCIVVDNGQGDALDIVDLGIKALPGYITGVIIVQYDSTLVLPENYAMLEKFHHQAPQYAVLPGYQLQNGYPALFPIESYHAISGGLMMDKLIGQDSDQIHAGSMMGNA